MKLEADLLPESLWGRSLYNILKRKDWERLRGEALRRHNNRCGICDSQGRLSGHEVWELDDAEHKATIVGVVVLCDLCHAVKHLGRTVDLGITGEIDIEPIIEHFCKVNECNREVFWEHYHKGMDIWRKRTLNDWTVDYSPVIGP